MTCNSRFDVECRDKCEHTHSDPNLFEIVRWFWRAILPERIYERNSMPAYLLVPSSTNALDSKVCISHAICHRR